MGVLRGGVTCGGARRCEFKSLKCVTIGCEIVRVFTTVSEEFVRF